MYAVSFGFEQLTNTYIYNIFKVFKPDDMRSLLVKGVLPRLKDTIKTRLHINPKNQELGIYIFVIFVHLSLFRYKICLSDFILILIFNNVLDVFNCIIIWKDLFVLKVFNQLFEDTFFPKWL